MLKKIILLFTTVLFNIPAHTMYSPFARRVLKKSAIASADEKVANPDWQKKIVTCMQDCIRVYYFWHRHDLEHISYKLVKALGSFASQDHKQPLFTNGPLLSSQDLKKLNDRAKKYKDSEPYIASHETKESVALSHHEALKKSCSKIKDLFSNFSDLLSIQIQEDNTVILQSQYKTAKKILELLLKC